MGLSSETLEMEREEIAERIKPDNCMYCGCDKIDFEGAHFPRFFFSCRTCERRIEKVYNWVTQRGEFD